MVSMSWTTDSSLVAQQCLAESCEALSSTFLCESFRIFFSQLSTLQIKIYGSQQKVAYFDISFLQRMDFLNVSVDILYFSAH